MKPERKQTVNPQQKHMATYKKEEVVRGLDKPFASENFVVRITKMEKTRSSAGNPMVTTDVEIVEPATVKAGSDIIQTAGLSGRLFGMLDPGNPLGLSKLVGALERAGLAPAEVQGLGDDDVFDDEPDKLRLYVGKTFRMTISCKPRLVMRNPTPEEARAGVKRTPMKDENGKELTAGNQLDLDWGNVTGPAGDGEGF